jgi:hypothetical protein
MAFIKLKKPQEIVDNIHKIKKGDLVYIKVPKQRNPVWKKCFMYGSALANTEVVVNSFDKRKQYVIHLLAGESIYTVVFYEKSRTKSRRTSPPPKQIILAGIHNYQQFMNSTRSLNLKGIT